MSHPLPIGIIPTVFHMAMAEMIAREPAAAAGARYDLAVIGGGIHGAALALEAARRGLRPLLLERGDFGEGTSANSLGILHGGLRYLQRLDLKRFRASVGERRWWFRHFPALVDPLPCLMPLYGEGLRRPEAFRAAFLLDRWLARDRNRGVSDHRHLPAGRLLDPAATAERFPAVERDGLRGGALWHDGAMASPQRLLMELLLWAARCGGQALNQMEVVDLLVSGGRVSGLVAIDRLTGDRLAFEAPVAVNCAGPAARRLAARFDREIPALFRPVLAFNLFLACRRPMTATVALTPPNGARSYFLRPWQDGLLVGTEYAPWNDLPSGDPRRPQPSEGQIAGLLTAINRAAPALRLRRDDVARVFAGLLPGIRDGSEALATRDILWDHAAHGGPAGLFSLTGIKFTTARLTAERLLRMICRRQGRSLPPYRDEGPPAMRPRHSPADFARLVRERPDAAAACIEGIIRAESVVYFEDLVLRRLDWPVASPTDVAHVYHLYRSLTGHGGTLYRDRAV